MRKKRSAVRRGGLVIGHDALIFHVAATISAHDGNLDLDLPIVQPTISP